MSDLNTRSEGLENKCEELGKAFLLGYENWYNPSNPYVKGTIEFFDYEWGVSSALYERGE